MTSNDLIKLEPENYHRLFKVKSIRYLIDDIWMGFYRQLNVFITFVDDEFTSYLPKEVMAQTLKEGLKLFTSTKFKAFKTEFLLYLEEVNKESLKCLSKEKISPQDCLNMFSNYSKLFNYYSKTEFFYTEQAYLQSKDNPFLQSNLNELSALKNLGRDNLNKIFFGENAYLNQIILKLSSQLGVSVEDLQQYSRQEILNLFENKKVDKKTIEDRNLAFVIIGTGKDIITVEGEEAKTIIKPFFIETNSSLITGKVANHGKIIGRVKVIVSGYHNFDNIGKIMNDMQKGDVLVSETTSPELLPACHKASAIVTDQGGLLSHAAIIAREMKIPCIVGTENATKVLKDGDLVEVDAEKGIVRKIK